MHTQKEPVEINLAWPWFLALGVAAVGFRVVPYLIPVSPSAAFLWNFVPVGAVALFAGARLRHVWAYLVPLAIMAASDGLLVQPLASRGMAAFSVGTPILYGSFLLYVFLGRCLRYTQSPFWIALASFTGSLQFFLVSNFAVWALGHGVTYPMTLQGLETCYYMALPFFRNTLAGDFIYSGVFFGLYALAVHPSEEMKASQPA
jgi:hypothetical protein